MARRSAIGPCNWHQIILHYLKIHRDEKNKHKIKMLRQMKGVNRRFALNQDKRVVINRLQVYVKRKKKCTIVNMLLNNK